MPRVVTTFDQPVCRSQMSCVTISSPCVVIWWSTMRMRSELKRSSASAMKAKSFSSAGVVSGSVGYSGARTLVSALPVDACGALIVHRWRL